MLFCFGDAVEGGCDEGTFEIFFLGRRGWWVACCDGEIIDKFENEEAGKGTAEVRDAIVVVSCCLGERKRWGTEMWQNVRSKQSHIGAANCWVRDLRMES